MGIWGVKIFEDDEACDVRDSYLRLVAHLTPEQAVIELVRSMEPEKDEGDTVFWLALAATQLQKGHLQRHVQEKALHVIVSGEDINRWIASAKPDKVEKRKKVLSNLQKRLQSSMIKYD